MTAHTLICPLHQVYYPADSECPRCFKDNMPTLLRTALRRLNDLEARVGALESRCWTEDDLAR